MKYVEFCAGLGGSRSGLDAAGWECVLAVDSDPYVAELHSLAFGSCDRRDVKDFAVSDLPDCDAIVAGFPCQPFSSSGNRSGFAHRSGTVFEHIARLIRGSRPNIVILENVQGLLSNKAGHTFARVLIELTSLGYTVDWAIVDVAWFDVPQTRPRLVVVATLDARGLPLPSAVGEITTERSALSPLFAQVGIKVSTDRRGSLSAVEADRRPEIGKAVTKAAMPFGFAGRAFGDHFTTLRVHRPERLVPETSLRDIIAPEFEYFSEIRSARYWAYDGPSSLHLRHQPVSHCVGTSIGGAPLYAVPLGLVSREESRQAFLAYSNWNREEDGYLVTRLRQRPVGWWAFRRDAWCCSGAGCDAGG